MTNMEYRQRFLELARKVAEAFEVTPLAPTGREQDPELCLELHTEPWIVRFFHRSDSGLISPDVALIEIVIGTPVAENAPKLYAHLLTRNELEWPAAYAVDEQTGCLIYVLRIALETADAVTVVQAISQALLGFSNWSEEGAVMLPEQRLSASNILELQ